MSLKHVIRWFLDDMDSAVLAHGKNYYHSGRVERIDWEEGHAVAESFGSEKEPYLVEIGFSENGEVEDRSYEYHYDWGPICKHTATTSKR